MAAVVGIVPIRRWYGNDSRRNDAEIGWYLAQHFTGPEQPLLRSGGFLVVYTRHDRSLDEHATGAGR